jgi:hypothetical protein
VKLKTYLHFASRLRIMELYLHSRICFRAVVLISLTTGIGRAIAQAVSRWLPIAAVRGSKPDLVMWDLW